MKYKKTKCALLMIALLSASSVSQAAIVCGAGKVMSIMHPYGSGSTIRFKMEMQSTNNKLYEATSYGYMTTMWWSNATRWDNRISMLMQSFENNTPIKIVTWDNDCKGSQDEFEIVMCSSRRECGIGTVVTER